MPSTLKPLEQAERCLKKAETIRLRRIDGGIALCGLALPLLFQHAAEKARAAGYPSLAYRIETAKGAPGQPECDFVGEIRELIRAEAYGWTACSQCGGWYPRRAPGDRGFSHCANHRTDRRAEA